MHADFLAKRGSSMALLALAAATAQAQSVSLQSVSSTGIAGANSYTTGAMAREPSLSADGRFVVFTSDAQNLSPGDNFFSEDVFVRDRLEGSTRAASVSLGGLPGSGASFDADVSADGRFVMFRSVSSSLVAGDTNLTYDIFVRDMDAGITERVNVSSSGAEANGHTSGGRISAVGGHVAFSSSANNLVPGDFPATADVFLRDRVSGTTELVTIDIGGGFGSGSSTNPELSSDGRFVCFQSTAEDLVAQDVNGFTDVFVRDRLVGATELASVSTAGAQANGESGLPVISADGRFVAFESEASNLVAGDTNGDFDVFVRDRQLATTLLGSMNSSGIQSDRMARSPALSGDGRLLGFVSNSTNLVPVDTNGAFDVFLRDLAAGTTSRVSESWLEQQIFGASGEIALSADGHYAAFSSAAPDVAPLSGLYGDIYVRNLAIACAPMESYCTAKVNSIGCRPIIGTADVPYLYGFDSFFITAYAVLPNKSGLLFWGTSPASLPFGGGTLCVKPPLVRTTVQTSQPYLSPVPCMNQGTFSYHFRQSYMHDHGLWPGVTLFAQYWSRDPGFAPPDNMSLSDALQFTICN